MGIKYDLYVALRELPYLRYILHGRKKAEYPESKVMTGLKAVKDLFIGERWPSKRFIGQTSICASENIADTDDEKIKWLFINGICTNESVLINNCLELSKLFGAHIYPIHNLTEGAVLDLYECVIGRTLDKNIEITNVTYLSICNALLQNDKVILIGHSQGGIICSNIAQIFKDDEEFYENKLEIYTFGSAHDEFDYKHSEHFANELDYVARTGAIEYKSKCKGQTFIGKGLKGHFLNENYLANFKAGLYCTKKSKLFNYIRRQEQ